MTRSRKIAQAKGRKVPLSTVKTGARALASAMVHKVAGRKNAKAKSAYKSKKNY